MLIPRQNPFTEGDGFNPGCFNPFLCDTTAGSDPTSKTENPSPEPTKTKTSDPPTPTTHHQPDPAPTETSDNSTSNPIGHSETPLPQTTSDSSDSVLPHSGGVPESSHPAASPALGSSLNQAVPIATVPSSGSQVQLNPSSSDDGSLPTTSSSQLPAPLSTSSHRQLPIGAIIGGIVGGLVLVGFIAAALTYLRRHCRRKYRSLKSNHGSTLQPFTAVLTDTPDTDGKSSVSLSDRPPSSRDIDGTYASTINSLPQALASVCNRYLPSTESHSEASHQTMASSTQILRTTNVTDVQTIHDQEKGQINEATGSNGMVQIPVAQLNILQRQSEQLQALTDAPWAFERDNTPPPEYIKEDSESSHLRRSSGEGSEVDV